MSDAPFWALLFIGLATGCATLAGGSLVLRFSSALELILGFSAGTLIGVAFFDLLPEGLDLAGAHRQLNVTTAAATGFLLYFAAERGSRILSNGGSTHRHFAPASLTLHSFLDGLGIGLAFHVSLAAGIIVALGVLAHDFLDGANTVAVSLSNGSTTDQARLWLAADAAAPLAGILLARTLYVPVFWLAMLLGVFAGFFLYIGASDLLPRSQSQRPRLSTVAATAAGVALIYLLIFIAGQGGA